MNMGDLVALCKSKFQDLEGSKTEIFKKTVPLGANWFATCDLSGATGRELIVQVEM